MIKNIFLESQRVIVANNQNYNNQFNYAVCFVILIWSLNP